jgi:pyruvate kinase
MASVCLGAEKMPSAGTSTYRIDRKFQASEEAIAMATMYSANHLEGVKAMISMTESGKTPLMMSRLSSRLPIFALSRNQSTLNKSSLYRGVTPVYFDSYADAGHASAQEAIDTLKGSGYVDAGDLVIITQGDVMDIIGSTNCMRILEVK